MSTPVPAAAVANEFLRLQGESSEEFPPIDNLKIQKLIFYAHAWFLAIKERPLIEESIEAWPWGPVVRSIYLEFKEFGNRPIVGKLATRMKARVPPDWPAKGRLTLVTETPTLGHEHSEMREHIREIWDVHKKYTGVQLSNSTHGKGQPWRLVKDRYDSLDHKPTIPNALIQSIFQPRVIS